MTYSAYCSHVNPLSAYMSAARYIAALHHGLVPCTTGFEEGCPLDRVPLFPDDILREWPTHLIEANALYSSARISRIIKQTNWSIGLTAVGFVVGEYLANFDLTGGPPPKPTLRRLRGCAETFLKTFSFEVGKIGWQENENRPDYEGHTGSEEELLQLCSRLTLLTGMEEEELRKTIMEDLVDASKVLISRWKAFCQMAVHLITGHGIMEEDALRLGGNILDARFETDPQNRALAQYWRLFPRADKAFQTVVDRVVALGGASATDIPKDAVGFLPEPTVPPIGLQNMPVANRAGCVLLAIFNGGYFAIDEAWNLSEILPYRYVSMPIRWHLTETTPFEKSERAALLTEAGWELQTRIAGEIAGIIQMSGVQAAKFHREDFIAELSAEDSAVFLRTIGHFNGNFVKYLGSVVDETLAILRKHWKSVVILTDALGADEPPTPQALRILTPTLTGARHCSDSPIRFLCDYVRERVYSDSLRADHVEGGAA